MIRIRSLSLLVLLSVVIFGCKSFKVKFPPPVLEYPDFVKFCQLPQYKNEVVYIRAIYFKKDDIYQLSSPDSCQALTAKLYLSDDILTNKQYMKTLNILYNHKQKDTLILDIIGQFEDEGDAAGNHSVHDKNDPKFKFIVKFISNMATK